jgi:hypothetical protein
MTAIASNTTIKGVPNFCQTDLKREGVCSTTCGDGVTGVGEVAIFNALLQRHQLALFSSIMADIVPSIADTAKTMEDQWKKVHPKIGGFLGTSKVLLVHPSIEVCGHRGPVGLLTI